MPSVDVLARETMMSSSLDFDNVLDYVPFPASFDELVATANRRAMSTFVSTDDYVRRSLTSVIVVSTEIASRSVLKSPMSTDRIDGLSLNSIVITNNTAAYSFITWTNKQNYAGGMMIKMMK